ncbi:MAG: M23 family metallopeptidase [Deltaproteobacteria bacterium]|nr:M23 family metallopeptidase [Deltaproteobacteria bacterium]
MAIVLRYVFVLFLLVTTHAFAAEAAKVSWPSALEVLQGQIAELKVTGENLVKVEGRKGKEVLYFASNGSGVHTALLGVDVEAKPAQLKLSLKAFDDTGLQLHAEIPLTIKANAYHKESFNVPPSFDQMTPETLAEIRREQAAFAKAFATTAQERFWETPFARPVPQEASASSFGARRVINGVPRPPHTGTDLSSPTGTEVVASNHGRVVLVGHFFFAGGSVVIDHGGGLYSMYFHLSEFRVDEGAMVRRGDVVALSGGTGRVTGPHLHWGIRLNNTRVDPLDLLRKFGAPPSNPAASTKADK